MLYHLDQRASFEHSTYEKNNYERSLLAFEIVSRDATLASLALIIIFLIKGAEILLWPSILSGIGFCLSSILAHKGYAFTGRNVAFFAMQGLMIYLCMYLGAASHAYFIAVPVVLLTHNLTPEKTERIIKVVFSVVCILFTLFYEYFNCPTTDVGDDPHIRIVLFMVAMFTIIRFIQIYIGLNKVFRERTDTILDDVSNSNSRLVEKRQKTEAHAKELEGINQNLKAELYKFDAIERKLRSSNEQLEQFAYAASHDLKEPLRSISSFVQVIRRRIKDRADDDLTEYFDFVVNGTSQMAALLDGLLVYSRVGRIEEPKVELSIERCTQHALYELKSICPTLDTCVEVSDSIGICVAERRGVQQVLSEVLKNACHFNSDDRPLKVVISETTAPYGMRCIEIQDNGIGIEKKYHDKVFLLFQSLIRTGAQKRTGIGLALAKKIILHNGGEIGIRENDSKGTCVWFTLPAIAQPEEN